MSGTAQAHQLSLTVQYASAATCTPSRALLRRWISIALQRDAKITVRIVDEPEGRALNKQYRGKDDATNVLTFVYDEGVAISNSSSLGQAGLALVQGDIVLCAPVVEGEAVAQHKDLLAHYAHLAIHATLHLQGYVHELEADASKMETLETALMLKLHYPDPYLVI